MHIFDIVGPVNITVGMIGFIGDKIVNLINGIYFHVKQVAATVVHAAFNTFAFNVTVELIVNCELDPGYIIILALSFHTHVAKLILIKINKFEQVNLFDDMKLILSVNESNDNKIYVPSLENCIFFNIGNDGSFVLSITSNDCC